MGVCKQDPPGERVQERRKTELRNNQIPKALRVGPQTLPSPGERGKKRKCFEERHPAINSQLSAGAQSLSGRDLKKKKRGILT